MLVDELVELADAPLPKTSDAVGLKAEVEKRRLQIDARKWAAGKLNRLLYSEDPRQAAAVQVNISNNTDAGQAALEEITRRLNRKREALKQRAAEEGRDKWACYPSAQRFGALLLDRFHHLLVERGIVGSQPIARLFSGLELGSAARRCDAAAAAKCRAGPFTFPQD